MHALRICDEGIELLSTKNIVFPYSNDKCKHYIGVKNGLVDTDLVYFELDLKLETLKDLEEKSDLPKSSPELDKQFEEFLEQNIRKFYQNANSTI
jgi:hypothetical protein